MLQVIRRTCNQQDIFATVLQFDSSVLRRRAMLGENFQEKMRLMRREIRYLQIQFLSYNKHTAYPSWNPAG
jgi:hypothetical protein